MGHKSIPFWSWNDELSPDELREQIRWMHSKGIGGFFMHARSGLKTEYLSKKWMECVEACADEAEKLGMEAWAYDENGWPSGFCGGKLLEDPDNCDMYFTATRGEYDGSAYYSYIISDNKLVKSNGTEKGEYVNVFLHRSVSTADVLNKDVVKKFINSTHERYKNEVKGKIVGFFTDEPQYYRPKTPYTRVLPDYILNKYGDDITENLGLLFYNFDGYKEFRYKYYKSMQELMLSSFAEQVYNWCDENGYQLTGHYTCEETLDGQLTTCGGVMPFYEYEHIPGIDFLGRSQPRMTLARQLDSVCTQLGKEHRLAEIFACSGWDATPLELKGIADALYANGVTLTCQHLLPVTERGNRKRDYPEHFSWVNPWVEKNFGEFNAYYNELSDIITENKPVVNVAIFHPIRSAYFDFIHSDFKNGSGNKDLNWLNGEFDKLTAKYNDNNIMFHYVDETILAKHGKTENGILTIGECNYKYLVFPSIYTMDKSSYDIISKFISDGGKVLFEGLKPTYLEYKEFSYNFNSNVTFDEIKNDQPFTSSVTKDITSRLIKMNDGSLKLFVANGSKDERVITLARNGANSLECFDLATKLTEKKPLTITLNGYQSLFITFSDEKIKEAEPKKDLYISGGKFDVIDFNENYLTLDCVEYSYDGENYFDKINVRKLFKKLLNDRYKGDLYLKYSFDCDYVSDDMSFIAEHDTVYFNGELLTNPTDCRFGRGFYKFDVHNLVKIGKNDAVLKYNYFQNDNVYYALFGEGVTESLRNCLVYDTDIESAYLVGKFGVTGDLHYGCAADVIRGKNFKVIEPKYKNLTTLIMDGYPFLSGDITVKKVVELSDVNYVLNLDKRFHMVELKINGKNLGCYMMTSKIDVSDYLKKGKNEIELTITIGNRNTLGPFHNMFEENLGVGPSTWDGCVRDDYSFVKTIF